MQAAGGPPRTDTAGSRHRFSHPCRRLRKLVEASDCPVSSCAAPGRVAGLAEGIGLAGHMVARPGAMPPGLKAAVTALALRALAPESAAPGPGQEAPDASRP
ncbi:MAG: hypothetical protein JWM19_4189 [Actinomycetia bacterium]|nr:hypothetical protein [Actinomycetes bacterium]